MRVVHAANFVVADIFVAQLFRQAVHHLVGFLRDGLLYLHLQNQVRAALQIQAELDLSAEVVFDLRHRGRKVRQADESVNADKDYRRDEHCFPLQIRIHDEKERLGFRRDLESAATSTAELPYCGR